MTEIMRKLPKDLQREVWAFIGIKSIVITPTAKIIKEYYEDQQQYCYEYVNEYDGLSLIFKGERISGGNIGCGYPNSFWFEKFYSVRFYFQQMVFRANKELYKKYKHIDLTEELGEWINDPKCEHCSYPLTLKDYNCREDYGELSCSDCYGMNSGIIGDYDAVEEYCNNCEKTLIGLEWRHLMNKYEYAGMCFRCMEIEEEEHGVIEEEEEDEEEEEEEEEE